MKNKNEKQIAMVGNQKKKDDGIKRFSFSAFNSYKCPLHWKLNYVDKLRIYKPSIYGIFGTTCHEIIQDYLTVMYNKSLKESSYMNLNEMFVDRFFKIFKEEQAKTDDKIVQSFSEIEEMIEQFKNIIKDFKTKWKMYFNVRDYELIGIEKTIETPLYTRNDDKINSETLKFYGFVDVIMRNKKTGIITIIDLKTSYKKWSKDKENSSKDQLLFYKYYFYQQYKKQYNIEKLNDIVVMFIILKRNVWQPEDVDFVISHVAKIVPACKVAMKKSIKNFKSEIANIYEVSEDGLSHKLIDREFTPIKSTENCKWCSFKNTDHCPLWKTKVKKIKVKKVIVIEKKDIKVETIEEKMEEVKNPKTFHGRINKIMGK